MLQKNTFDFTSQQVWTVLFLRSNWAVVQELGCMHCLAFETNYFSKKLISSHPPNEHSRPIFRFTLSPIDSLFFLTCRNSEGVRLRFPAPAHGFDTTALLWLLPLTDPAEATGIWSRRHEWLACLWSTEQKPLDHPYFNRLRGAGWGGSATASHAPSFTYCWWKMCHPVLLFCPPSFLSFLPSYLSSRYLARSLPPFLSLILRQCGCKDAASLCGWRCHSAECWLNILTCTVLAKNTFLLDLNGIVWSVLSLHKG